MEHGVVAWLSYTPCQGSTWKWHPLLCHVICAVTTPHISSLDHLPEVATCTGLAKGISDIISPKLSLWCSLPSPQTRSSVVGSSRLMAPLLFPVASAINLGVILDSSFSHPLWTTPSTSLFYLQNPPRIQLLVTTSLLSSYQWDRQTQTKNTWESVLWFSEPGKAWFIFLGEKKRMVSSDLAHSRCSVLPPSLPPSLFASLPLKLNVIIY